jgi:hypothetical protein
MSVKRGVPSRERGGKTVGPDYPERNYRNPFDAGLDHESGSEDQKTLGSPSSTPTGVGIEFGRNYDKYWEGGDK